MSRSQKQTINSPNERKQLMCARRASQAMAMPKQVQKPIQIPLLCFGKLLASLDFGSQHTGTEADGKSNEQKNLKAVKKQNVKQI